MPSDPSPDLVLEPLDGQSRTLRQWITNFHLVLVALDPRAKQSAWILPTAGRILTTFEQADCRVAFLVAGDAAAARRFLGKWADEILIFADPERAAVAGLGLQRLPALVHIGTDGTIVGLAEGWNPPQWRRITHNLARLMSWSSPLVPGARDPGPFEGSPARR